MRVALVTTWPPRACGIATYARKLVAGMTSDDPAGLDLFVVAEEGGETGADGVPCAAAFRRQDAWAEAVIDAVTGGEAQVAHFQHAPDILGTGRPMIQACRGLRERGVRVVVTLHTVFTRWSGLLERRPLAPEFHRALGEATDALIVHGEGSREILASQGLDKSRVHVIPHGTDAPVRGDAAAGRTLLGLDEEAEVILFFGFIHIQKNIHVLVRALPRVIAERPEARLAVVGKVGGDHWYNRRYLDWLRRLAHRAGVLERLVVVPRFVSEDELADVHAAARVVALPHAQRYASASGVVHGALAMGVPLLCSDGPKFEEVGSHLGQDLLTPANDPEAWAQGLIGLLANDARRADVLRRTVDYADATRWPVVGAAHRDLYAG